MDLILVAVISLGAIGLIAAVILYAASKKFAVYEDPRIAKVSEVLPQANCGGCGYPGCSGFAGACVNFTFHFKIAEQIQFGNDGVVGFFT